jgi:hypothetical protein
VVVELREDDDGVQIETARTSVCRDWSVASCRCEETRPEVSIPTRMPRAWRRTTRAEGSWGWHAYHGFQEVKASLVARFAWSRWSDSVAMARRSFARRTVRSNRGGFHRSGPREIKQTCQRGAPVKGKEDREKRGTRGSPTAMQSGGYARWFYRFRRRISSDWRGLARGRKEG